MARRTWDHNVSDTGNWNVALSYAEGKIMKPLLLAEKYEELAKFGSTDIYENLFSNLPREEIKIEGFKRLVDTLIVLINNSLFAVKKVDDKNKLRDYKKELKLIYKNINKLYSFVFNEEKQQRNIRLNNLYDKVLMRVIEIKSLINEPLNKNDLIFTFKEDFDPRDFKNEIKDRMINKG